MSSTQNPQSITETESVTSIQSHERYAESFTEVDRLSGKGVDILFLVDSWDAPSTPLISVTF